MAKKAFENRAGAYNTGEEIYTEMPRADELPAPSGASQQQSDPTWMHDLTGGMFGSSNKRGYDVNRGYFDPTANTGVSVRSGRFEHYGRADRFTPRFSYGRGVRNEMLDRIGGFESQAEMLQRSALENARAQQLAMAGHAGPSSRAAALRGAQMGAAGASQDIHRAARERRLAEEMGMLGALGGIRGADIKDELQRQAYELDQMRIRQDWERMSQAERAANREMGMRGEGLQAQAHAAWLGQPMRGGGGEAVGGLLQSIGSLWGNRGGSSTTTETD